MPESRSGTLVAMVMETGVLLDRVILRVEDGGFRAVGPKAVGGGIAHPHDQFGHEDRKQHRNDAPLHGGRGLVRSARRRNIMRAKHGQDSEEGARRAALHHLEDLLAQPARAEQPVVRLLVAALPGIDNVIPEVVALVIQNRIGAPCCELDRVQKEAEVGWGVHGDSVCCDLNRMTMEVIFYSGGGAASAGESLRSREGSRVRYTNAMTAPPVVLKMSRHWYRSSFRVR
jgi:hypothetical protein